MIFIVALALCARVAMSQPSSCSANSHCNEGYFCELSVYQCLPCLRCEDYKRAAPAHTTLCTTSVSQCGGCLPGLVEDGSGNLEAACVTSSLLWILLGVAAVFVLFGGVLIYLLRKTETLKILTSATRTSVQPSALCADPERAGAPPPPYNAAYSPVRATSPPPDAPPSPRPPRASARPTSPPRRTAWPTPARPLESTTTRTTSADQSCRLATSRRRSLRCWAWTRTPWRACGRRHPTCTTTQSRHHLWSPRRAARCRRRRRRRGTARPPSCPEYHNRTTTTTAAAAAVAAAAAARRRRSPSTSSCNNTTTSSSSARSLCPPHDTSYSSGSALANNEIEFCLGG